MNMGTYRSSPEVTRKFCRVCGTSLFSPDDGWEVVPENLEVSMTNMYHREYRGIPGRTVDVSVGAMDSEDAKKWVEVVEHIFLDDTVEGGHVVSAKKLPMYVLTISC
jgi:hypothetical protein